MLPKVYYPRAGQPPKSLTPSNSKELAALQRIGWKLQGELDDVSAKALQNPRP